MSQDTYAAGRPPGQDPGRIALVGMGCRFPGEVDSPAALWRLLMDAREALGDPPAERAELWAPHGGQELGAQTLADGTPVPVRAGYLRDVAGFDADFFGVSGREADVLDPQHRLLLEVAWEALEHAGMPPERLAGTSTGVFTGLSYHDYLDCLDWQPHEQEGSILANGHCVAAGRISYLLGLHGPCVALDTACSSSLVAVHLAAQALRAGECDLALAGGVTLMFDPKITRSFTRMGMLSRSGHCHAFDAAADGFVRGEGCGIVVLKRLADAVRDGDRVLAVLRGSAVNQDGRSDGLAAPSAAAQRALYEEALARAGVAPREVGMVEAHGPGTPVGDPVEFASLAEVYGSGPGRCALASVKTNLGHLEPAAGVAGLIKAVLCLGRGTIPPNLHFTRWNPAIENAGATRLFVPTEPTRWPTLTASRLAAVSSFGFSGTNAHVLLEEPPATSARRRVRPPRRERDATPLVFLVPAGSRAALPVAAGRLADWLEGDGAAVPLRDIAHTLAVRRSPGRGRLGVITASRRELVQVLRASQAGRDHPAAVTGEVGAAVSRRPVWVFSGQGSQWPGMGRGLLDQEPAFAAALAEADELIAEEAGFSVLDVVRSGEPVTGCARVQPVLFALQTALAAVWRAHGVEPAGVIGHSMGEVAAAVVAGALSLADGVRVICRRSALLTRVAGRGAMATVGLGADDVQAELDAQLDAESGATGAAVTVAVMAAPDATVVAGDTARLERLVADWEARGIPAALVAVDVASHSPQVDPLLADLREAIADLTPRRPQVPFYSTVLDEPRTVPAFDADYWCANLRRPVRFAAAVAAAAADRHLVYVEIAPHPVVTHSVGRCLEGVEGLDRGHVVLPTLRRDEDETATFRTQLAALHCAGVPVDWTRLYPRAALADVPTMTFDRKRHWTEPALPAVPGRQPGPAAGPLPGSHTEVPGDPVRHTWHGEAGTAALPWLDDHKVYGTPVLPGAAHYALALTTACEVFDARPTEVEVTDVHFREPLRLAERTDITTTLTLAAADRADCEIFGHGDDGTWVRQSTAVVRRLTGPPRLRAASVENLALRHPVPLEPASLYANMRARGLHHGPAFNGITQMHASRRGDSFWARVEIPEAARTPEHALRVHPALVDLCGQLLISGLLHETDHGLILPVRIRSVRVLGDTATAVYCHARVVEATSDTLIGHIRLLDEAGTPVLAIDGLRLVRHAAPETTEVDHWFLETGWHRAERPAPAATGPAGDWLVVGEGGTDASARELADALRAAGARADVCNWPPVQPVHRLDAFRETMADRLARGVTTAVVLLSGTGAGTDPDTEALARTRRTLGAAQAIAARGAEPPRVYVVTRGARAVAPGEVADPAQSPLRGLVRVLALEHPRMRATLVDTAPPTAGAGAEAIDTAWLSDLAAELLADAPEDEVALRGPTRHVARLAYVPLTDAERSAAAARTVRYGVDGFRLRAGRLGDLGSLELAATGRRRPGPGEVELRVSAAGLNFRDVLTAMGLLPGDSDIRYRIGFESAGEVTAVGAGVTDLAVGDRVLAADVNGGAFGSFAVVPAEVVAPAPAGFDAVSAAGLPIAFLTAWYALRHVARLAPGERVLIHSATGGTGLAAIAVARLLGAEVLATAGSEDKRRFLHGMGITHVMDSRSLDFCAQARAATGGEGVDVVLNSLSGAAIRAGLEALRPFGRFVELGVRDILSDAPLGLAPLRHNITLSTVDLGELQRDRPAVFGAALREVVAELAEGRLAPLRCTAFPLSAATDAFRLMAGAGHIGKLVLTLPEEGEAGAVLPDGPQPVCEGAAYVITGGLRGLGLATARWLAARRAGHLVLGGRTAPTAATARALRELSADGTRITVVLGDIARPGTAERLVAAATADGMPLRGVVHSAMVLDDAAVTNIRDDQLRRVWAPKVTGAWRLHQATAGQPLDWFAVFSSMASLLGNPGQGAYAAANAWLDGFAGWRSACGLPTLAVNWGPWGETGVATGFADRGYETIPTDRGIRALDALLAHGRVQTGVIPGEPRTWIPVAGRQSALFGPLLPNDAVGTDGTDGTDGTQSTGDVGDCDDIRARLAALPAGLARRSALEAYLGDHIRTVLRLSGSTLDPQTSLKALGFDSLLAMELRVRLESALGVKLAANFVWQHPTVAELAVGLAEHMGLDIAGGTPGGRHLAAD
ncbi:type I polyketide synthase [Streptomyces sp. ME19-01-6]|uniref:type I polyketide synthase n=1 Tax=Streptomyces sp. ME19-01-6 TaxID=3028686 RepID=UPI00299FFAB2|nr:type I polyketide synthase [Streptomyces sp. ME19-01-6]MDX3228053.1 type I polyketide synthase [Streptomyces sp. ME19-01-6]